MTVTMTGSRRLASSRHRVWAALNDVACLRRCIPACETLEQVSETRFRTSVVVRLGPLRVPVDGVVEITASCPPNEYSLRGRGGAAVLGHATGMTRISLTEVGTGCHLHYAVEATATGPLAAFGPTALTAVAKAMTDRFTKALADTLDGSRSTGAPPL